MKLAIKKSRFKEMFKIRNISEKKFGLKLEQEGTIAYRSLQRNLASETMKEPTLIRCAELLDCHPAYLEGKSNLVWDGDRDAFFKYNGYYPLLDSEGIYIPSFEEYLADIGWDSNIELFKKWASAMRITAITKKKKVHTLSDLIKYRLECSDIYDEVNVYDDLMEACTNLLRQYISDTFNDNE